MKRHTAQVDNSRIHILQYSHHSSLSLGILNTSFVWDWSLADATSNEPDFQAKRCSVVPTILWSSCWLVGSPVLVNRITFQESTPVGWFGTTLHCSRSNFLFQLFWDQSEILNSTTMSKPKLPYHQRHFFVTVWTLLRVWWEVMWQRISRFTVAPILRF